MFTGILFALNTVLKIVGRFFKAVGYAIGVALKYIGLGLWHGVIKLPVYLVRLFARLFRRRNRG